METPNPYNDDPVNNLAAATYENVRHYQHPEWAPWVDAEPERREMFLQVAAERLNKGTQS